MAGLEAARQCPIPVASVSGFRRWHSPLAPRQRSLGLAFAQHSRLAGTEASHVRADTGVLVEALPRALGFRLSFSPEWVPPVVGLALFPVTVGVMTYALLSRPVSVIGWIVPMYPLLWLLTPIYYVTDPRYLYFLWPFLVLLIAIAIEQLARSRAWALIIVISMATVSWWGVEQMISQRRAVFHAPDVAVPVDLSTLVDELQTRSTAHVFAHYALAYPITFESDREILATPISPARNQALDRTVRSHPSPGYVFMADSVWVQDFREAAARLGVNPRCERLGEFVLCQPSTKLLPEQVGDVWSLPAG